MKLKYLLIGANHDHDESVKIFKADVTMDVINEHLKSYLSEIDCAIDCLQDLTDRFHELQQELKDDGFDHQTYDVIKYYLMEYRETYVTIEETELCQ
jgi:uncharacterized protein (UPF0335 family)